MTISYNLGALKREARRRVNATFGLTLSAALNQVAVENGYADWMTLARKIETPISGSMPLSANEGPGT